MIIIILFLRKHTKKKPKFKFNYHDNHLYYHDSFTMSTLKNKTVDEWRFFRVICFIFGS